MRFTLVVNANPYSSQAQDSAYRFACAVIEAGYAVVRVFFYRDGVLAGNGLSAPPDDEIDIGRRWRELADQHGIELIACVAAALRRGVLDPDEAERWEKPAHNLAPGFELGGLGQLAEAIIGSDRVLEFN